MPLLVGLCYWLMRFWAFRHANIHIRTLIRFLLRIFCIGAKIHLTLKIHGLAWITSGQLPNFLGAPGVIQTPTTLSTAIHAL